MDRDLDLRDSTVQDRDSMTRKGRVSTVAAASGELQRQKCTPWGEPVGPQQLEPNQPLEPTARTNHFQNIEAPEEQGQYQCPEPSTAHNHLQNQETDQVNGKLKMSSSRINEAEALFVPPTVEEQQASVPRGKVAQGTSRINEGNDIFGGPTSPMGGRSPPPRQQPFQERPSTGHVKGSQWLGYTSHSNSQGS